MATAQREWFEKDFYKVLGVPPTSTDKEITSAYRKLAKQLHPDANPGDAKAEDRFKEVSAAYDVLGDTEKRKEYDEIRSSGGPRSGVWGAPGRRAGEQGGAGFRVDDLTDFLGGMFNGGGAPGGAGAGTRAKRATGPKKGEDLEASLHISFREAVDGGETTVNITSDVACSTCNGVGSAPGTSPVICSQCGGRGVLDDNQGLFGFSRPCNGCRGTGMRIETPCNACKGSGIERRPRSIKVRIPRGVQDGQVRKYAQRGGAGLNGGPPGDLLVTFNVQADERFGRSGDNLTIVAPVRFDEAVLGATIRVPTLEGAVSVKVPPGTPSGRVLRVRGRGVTSGSKVGDLLVTVELVVPKTLNAEQQAAVAAVARAFPDDPRAGLQGNAT